MLRAPLALGFALLALGACRQDGEAPPAAGTADTSVVTPVEVAPGSVVLPSGEEASAEPGGEPGVPGSPRPDAAYSVAGGRCYVYPRWAVIVRPRGANPGEDVTVAARTPGADPRALCASPPDRPAFALADPASPDYFFGLIEDLLLVDTGTGPNDRLLRVVDLGSGQAVLRANYDEPVQVADGVLSFTEPVADYANVEGLRQSGVDCPQAAEWFESGLGVGVNRVVRFDLARRQRHDTSEQVCVPLQ